MLKKFSLYLDNQLRIRNKCLDLDVDVWLPAGAGLLRALQGVPHLSAAEIKHRLGQDVKKNRIPYIFIHTYFLITTPHR